MSFDSQPHKTMFLITFLCIVTGVLSTGNLKDVPNPINRNTFNELLPESFAEIKLIHNETNMTLVSQKFSLALKTITPAIDQNLLSVKHFRTFFSPSDDSKLIGVLIIENLTLPKITWTKDTIMTRVRSALMNDHPDQMYDGVHHVEFVRFSQTGEEAYKWATPINPNIVLFVSDGHGYADAGWKGAPTSPTPTLDKIRQESVELKYLFGYPHASSTMASLWSGRFTHRNGYGPTEKDGRGAQFSGKETTLPEVLKGAGGYYTMGFEKWHLGDNEDRNSPLNRGFDAYFGPMTNKFTSRFDRMYFNNNPHKNFHLNQQMTAQVYTLFDTLPVDGGSPSQAGNANPPVINGVDGIWRNMHNTDAIKLAQEKALDSFMEIDQINHKPLFMYFGSRQPTTKPYELHSSPFNTSTPRGSYLHMLHLMDNQLSKLENKLKDDGMWKDTVFIYVSSTPGDASVADNSPLRGGKGSIWQQRLINLVKGTSSSKASLNMDARGSTNNDLIHVVDLFKTLCTGVAKIPPENFRKAWKCNRCEKHNRNILDGENMWQSIIKKNGANIITSSTRTFVTHVTTNKLIELSKYTDTQVQNYLPRHQWDKATWNQSNFKTMVGERLHQNFDNFRDAAEALKTGYVQRGRLSLLFSNNSTHFLNMAKPPDNNTDPDASLAFLKDIYADFPESIYEGRAYLHDVWANPERTTNLLLLGKTMTQEQLESLYEMINYYKEEQLDQNSLVDLDLQYMWADDPSIITQFLDTGKWLPWCNHSIMCKHDNNVTRVDTSNELPVFPDPTQPPFYLGESPGRTEDIEYDLGKQISPAAAWTATVFSLALLGGVLYVAKTLQIF